ncbi:3'-5' exonuclease [Chryseobacterium phocaeense]|uniref:3'-5' exonuclease n=1 Tax=Chryseobacterium phocaeense TaxID=1816690 RepID=UPI0009BAD606|nr:3'-5' exonuclease [Chryseobacterium phocaeense]
MPYNWIPPLITELTTEQQAALNNPNSISVAGGPGTGKSVVALLRHIRNHDIGNGSLLMTYTKTLEHYLRMNAQQNNANAGQAVTRTLEWLAGRPTKQYEIIIDEAQDLEESDNMKIVQYADRVCFGADDQQILDPKRATTENRLREIFTTRQYPLSENFRNSYEIMLFCSAFFPNKLIPHNTLTNLLENGRIGRKPIIIKATNVQRNQAIIDVVNLFRDDILRGTHNLAILVPLIQDVINFTEIVESLNLNINFSYYHSKMPDFIGLENIHITTFKSAKGLEFDTVIIPDFQLYDYNITYMTKAPITENDYYVGLTRARRNLYLITSKIHPNLLGTEQSQTYTIEEY